MKLRRIERRLILLMGLMLWPRGLRYIEILFGSLLDPVVDDATPLRIDSFTCGYGTHLKQLNNKPIAVRFGSTHLLAYLASEYKNKVLGGPCGSRKAIWDSINYCTPLVVSLVFLIAY